MLSLSSAIGLPYGVTKEPGYFYLRLHSFFLGEKKFRLYVEADTIADRLYLVDLDLKAFNLVKPYVDLFIESTLEPNIGEVVVPVYVKPVSKGAALAYLGVLKDYPQVAGAWLSAGARS